MIVYTVKNVTNVDIRHKYTKIKSLLEKSDSIVNVPRPVSSKYDSDATFFVAIRTYGHKYDYKKRGTCRRGQYGKNGKNDENDEIVACIYVHKLTFFMSIVKYLYVKEQYRRHGLASRLNRQVAAHASNEYATPLLCCTVLAHNTPALHLFITHFHFFPVTRVNSPLSNRDIYVLIKRL